MSNLGSLPGFGEKPTLSQMTFRGYDRRAVGLWLPSAALSEKLKPTLMGER